MSDDVRAAIEDHVRLAGRVRDQADLIGAIAGAIITAFENGRVLYLLGNGGSAADAQHVAAEMVGRFKRNRRALPAVALTTDTSNLTAIGNDFSFDQVFSRQVEALVRPGDVVWASSTSGNSPNVIEAARAARTAEACVIGFTGRTGGRLEPLCDHCFGVDHEVSDRIQEIHQLAYHIICDRVEAHFTDAR